MTFLKERDLVLGALDAAGDEAKSARAAAAIEKAN